MNNKKNFIRLNIHILLFTFSIVLWFLNSIWFAHNYVNEWWLILYQTIIFIIMFLSTWFIFVHWMDEIWNKEKKSNFVRNTSKKHWKFPITDISNLFIENDFIRTIIKTISKFPIKRQRISLNRICSLFFVIASVISATLMLIYTLACKILFSSAINIYWIRFSWMPLLFGILLSFLITIFTTWYYYKKSTLKSLSGNWKKIIKTDHFNVLSILRIVIIGINIIIGIADAIVNVKLENMFAKQAILVIQIMCAVLLLVFALVIWLVNWQHKKDTIINRPISIFEKFSMISYTLSNVSNNVYIDKNKVKCFSHIKFPICLNKNHFNKQKEWNKFIDYLNKQIIKLSG